MPLDLQPLIDGLLYPSEDDRPFEVVDWPAGPVSDHMPPGADVQRLAAAGFFDPLRSTTDAARFAALRRGLAAHLSDLTVLRVSGGSAEVTVYVVGRTAAGRWAGVRTVSVET